jgi:hypothetical protein
LEILGNLEFDEACSIAPLVHGMERKNKFQANMGQEFEIPLKVEFGLISQ